MTVAKVQARGQVTVPQDIREACGVTPGSKLLFIKTGPDRFECQVLPPPRSLLEMIKQLTVDGPAPDVERLMAEAEAEEAERILDEMGVPWRSN